MNIAVIHIGELEVNEPVAVVVDIQRIRPGKPGFGIQNRFVPFVQQEIVSQPRVIHGVHTPPVIKQLILPDFFHGEFLAGLPQVLVTDHQFHFFYVVFGCTQPYHKVPTVQGKREIAVGRVQHGPQVDFCFDHENVSFRPLKGPSLKQGIGRQNPSGHGRYGDMKFSVFQSKFVPGKQIRHAANIRKLTAVFFL